MSEKYYYPFEIAKIPGQSWGVVKAHMSNDQRALLKGYSCCLCNKPWPGCSCPETEKQHEEQMEAILSSHPSVKRMREREQAYRKEFPGGWLSGQEYRRWELERYGNCI